MKVVCRSSGDDPRIRLTPIKWHMELMENVVAGKQRARNQKKQFAWHFLQLIVQFHQILVTAPIAQEGRERRLVAFLGARLL